MIGRYGLDAETLTMRAAAHNQGKHFLKAWEDAQKACKEKDRNSRY